MNMRDRPLYCTTVPCWHFYLYASISHNYGIMILHLPTGTLKAAKRKGLIKFKGQMLFKGMHDHVQIDIVE